jgi:hypothetical protein
VDLDVDVDVDVDVAVDIDEDMDVDMGVDMNVDFETDRIEFFKCQNIGLLVFGQSGTRMIEIPTMPEPPKQSDADRHFLAQDRTETMDAGCRIADTGVSFPNVDA